MKVTLPLIALTLCLGLAPLAAAGVHTPSIEGSYVEVRSCDVWTGPCFANGEMGVTGEEAMMAWDVARGSWNGVPLDGLRVIAVVRANATLGDTTKNPYPADSILVVDDRADEAQRNALIDFAQEMAGKLTDNVLRVDSAPITMSVGQCAEDGCAFVQAGENLQIETRCLHEHDKHCGNERAFYPPLTDVDNMMPAFTKRDKYRGEGLGVTWDDSGRRSAYLATFSR